MLKDFSVTFISRLSRDGLHKGSASQTGFLRTLGFHEGVQGLPWKADEGLGILSVAIIIITSIIMLNYEYEVMLKNDILHFQREYFRNKQALNATMFKPFWQLLPQEE